MRLKLLFCFFMIFAAISVNSVYAGDTIEDFVFKTVEGKAINSADFKDKPVVINIGTHW